MNNREVRTNLRLRAHHVAVEGGEDARRLRGDGGPRGDHGERNGRSGRLAAPARMTAGVRPSQSGAQLCTVTPPGVDGQSADLVSGTSLLELCWLTTTKEERVCRPRRRANGDARGRAIVSASSSNSTYRHPPQMRVTRSMVNTNKRRKASFELAPVLYNPSGFSLSPLRTPPTPARTPPSRFRLDDLPPEIGILIVDKLDTEAGANLTLVNKTVAGWVAKCLLAKVTRCEVEESAEPLDPADDVAHVQHFISAVTSVAIPSRERARFVSGLMQLHCRPDHHNPTLDLTDECLVLRGVVASWSAQRQGEVIAQYLSAELNTVKPISHFLKLPADSGSCNTATDERIFRMLNGVLRFAGEDGPSKGNHEALCRRRWDYLAEVMAILAAALENPERVATLIHIILGPNEFYCRLASGEPLDPLVEDDGETFFVTFDLDPDSAMDYAEDVGFNNFIEPWEAFDVSIAAFAELLTRLIPRMYTGRWSDALDFLSKFVACWSFEYKTALVAAMIRVDDASFAAYAAPLLSDRDGLLLPHRREELPEALFRVLARDSWTALDFSRAFATLSRGWSASVRRDVLSKVLNGKHVESSLLKEGCVCGCSPTTLNILTLRKLTWLGAKGIDAVAMDDAERRREVNDNRDAEASAGLGDDTSFDDQPEEDGLCSPRNTRAMVVNETETKGSGMGSGMGSGGGARTMVVPVTPQPATPGSAFVLLSEE